MTQIEVRNIVRGLVNAKGVNAINGYDIIAIKEKHGADMTQIQNAINYFRYGKGAKH